MNRVVVITGASGGLGLAAAKCFLAAGDTVYGLCRTPVPLDKVFHIPTDLTNHDAVANAFSEIAKREQKIDILLSNAGMGISGAVEFTEPADAQKIVEVNFLGAFYAIRNALPLMREAGGRIVCTSSAAAVFAIPFQAFYSATKAALNALVLALRNELRPFPVTICAVMPGDVKTGFTAARKKSTKGDEIYGGRIEPSVSVMEKDEQNGMSPDQIGAYLFRVATKKRVRALFTPGAKYKLFACINRLLPTSVVNSLVGGMYLKNK